MSHESYVVLNLLELLVPVCVLALILFGIISVLIHNYKEVWRLIKKHSDSLFRIFLAFLCFPIFGYLCRESGYGELICAFIITICIMLFMICFIIEGSDDFDKEEDKFRELYRVLYHIFHIIIGIVPFIIGYLMFFITGGWKVGQLYAAKTIHFCMNKEEK